MTPDELRPILTEYRKQVQQAWSKETAHPSFEGADGSPVGQCGVTSAWLMARLREDHPALYMRYCRGTYYDSPTSLGVKHCWLEHIDNRAIVVDLTADQFGDESVVCDTYRDLHNKGIGYVTHDATDRPETPVLARLALLGKALS